MRMSAEGHTRTFWNGTSVAAEANQAQEADAGGYFHLASVKIIPATYSVPKISWLWRAIHSGR